MRALRGPTPWRWLHDFSARRRRLRPGGDHPSCRSLRFETLAQRRLLTATSGGDADLIYDPTTGNLTMDTTGVESGYVVGYSIKSDGGFREENAVKPFNGALIARDNAISLLSLDHHSEIYHSGVFNVGDVAPVGLSLEGLSEFLVVAQYGDGGADALNFNLVLAAFAGVRPTAESDAATGTESTPVVVDVPASDISPNDETATSGWKADLIYNPTTGNLTIDSTGVKSGYWLGYSLKSNGGFRVENAAQPLNGYLFVQDDEISLMNLDHAGVVNLGDVAPIGLSLEELDEFLVPANSDIGWGLGSHFNLVLAGHAGARPSVESDAATGTENTETVVDAPANDISPDGETATSSRNADLIYDPKTGNLTIATTSAEFRYVVGYSIESDGGFREENAVRPFNGGLIARDNVIALLSLDHVSGIYHSGVFDLGDVAPIGLSLEGLSEFLVAAEYGGMTTRYARFGSDPLNFNLVLAGHAGARPSAESDAATGTERTSIVVDVLANDSSPHGEALTIQRVSIAQGRGEVFVQDNQIFYDPRGRFDYLRAGKQAQVEIVYSASNGLAMDTATLMVTITGENDVPLVGDDTVKIGAADAATDITAQLLGNDSDPDNDRMLEVTALETMGTRGIVVLSNTGRVYYDPAGRFEDLSFGETTTDTFQYQVTDRGGAVAEATVTVVVTGAPSGVDRGNDDNSWAYKFDHLKIGFDAPNIIEFNPEWADLFFGGDAPQRTTPDVQLVRFAPYPLPTMPNIDIEIASPSADFFVATRDGRATVLARPHDTTQEAALLSVLQSVRSNFGRQDATRADGDLDGDGVVQFSDVLILASKFDATTAAHADQLWETLASVRSNFGRQDATRADGDLDGDGVVQFSDVLILASKFRGDYS